MLFKISEEKSLEAFGNKHQDPVILKASYSFTFPGKAGEILRHGAIKEEDITNDGVFLQVKYSKQVVNICFLYIFR